MQDKRRKRPNKLPVMSRVLCAGEAQQAVLGVSSVVHAWCSRIAASDSVRCLFWCLCFVQEKRSKRIVNVTGKLKKHLLDTLRVSEAKAPGSRCVPS